MKPNVRFNENLVFLFILGEIQYLPQHQICNSYFFGTWWCKPVIVQALIIWFNITNSFKYLWSTKLDWKDKWLRKSEFVANCSISLLLLLLFYYYFYCLEAEVYCYNLPDMCFEDELVPFFSKAGTIQKLRILVHFSGFTK